MGSLEANKHYLRETETINMLKAEIVYQSKMSIRTCDSLKAEIAELKHTLAEMELYIHSLKPAYLGTRRQFQQ